MYLIDQQYTNQDSRNEQKRYKVKMDSKTILSAVTKTYESLNIYNDTGFVKTIYVSDGDKDGTIVKFKTSFVRSKYFEFEWQTNELGISRNFKIFMDDKHCTKREIGKEEEERFYSNVFAGKYASLKKAINNDTTSNGAVFLVPGLLIPSLGKNYCLQKFLKGKNIQYESQEKEYILKNQTKELVCSEESKLTISKSDFLIQKLTEKLLISRNSPDLQKLIKQDLWGKLFCFIHGTIKLPDSELTKELDWSEEAEIITETSFESVHIE